MTRKLLATLLVATLFASSCQTAKDEPQETDATLHIIAVVDPISDLIRQIGGSRVTVRSLVPSGSDAHTYAPRPRDALRLSETNLYVDVGLNLNDAALNLARANVSDPDKIVLIGEALAADQLINNHDDGSGTLHPNPHIWTSLLNVNAAITVIRDTLITRDPNGVDTYQANSEQLITSLNELDRDIARAVATIPERQRVLVTFHDAWTYFARDYGLTYAVAIQGRDYSDPSAAAVRNLIDQILTFNVTAVFGSAVFPSDVLAVIAEETGATYVTGLTDDLFPAELAEPASFQALMRYNARIIVGGLGGDTALLN